MLKALYDYAIRHELTLPAGYVNKTIKAYIQLDSQNTEYMGIYLNDDEPLPCPDIGSLANGTDKCNVLVEKSSVVFNKEPSIKNEFYIEALKSAADSVPELSVCVRVMGNPELKAKATELLERNKIKPSDRVSFMIDEMPIVKFDGIQNWWQEYRRQFQKPDNDSLSRCLITGELIAPVATTAKIQGLRSVGGHSSGDALICFDKNSFCSYDQKKAANAPVSDEAFSTVKAALDELLKDAPVLAGMKFVHWFDKNIAPENNPFFQCPDFGYEDDGDEDEPDETQAERDIREQTEREKANALIRNVKSEHERTFDLSNTRYYILLLSGVGGRVMIRRYERGNYRQLSNNIDLWHSDLALTNVSGIGLVEGCKLSARLLRLLKYQKTDNRPFERLDKELSGISPTVLIAILTGGQLPDTVAAKALAYIRSKMLGADPDDKSIPVPDSLACQWLKVWLIRRNRAKGKEAFLMETYNMELDNKAYHCGGIMAVYAAIQNEAMPDVNVGVVQRYYASACQSPALVIGQLSKHSQYHISKIENPWVAENYRRKLEEVYSLIRNSVPNTLNLEEQSYFALGYYQMSAMLNAEKRERIAAKKQKNIVENMEG